jgi:hypothetical protein
MSLYEIEEHIGVLIQEEDLPSDETFNNSKADAAEWIKANSIKVKPAKSPTPADTAACQKMADYKRESSKRPPNPRTSQSKRPNQLPNAALQNNRVKSVQTIRPEKQSKAADTAHKDWKSKSAPFPHTEQSSRPIRTMSRHVSPNSAVNRVAQIKSSTVQVQTAAKVQSVNTDNCDIPRKSFFQQILKRLFKK